MFTIVLPQLRGLRVFLLIDLAGGGGVRGGT
jgi:hypothetical protein